ncbi:MAG: cytochrome b [Rhodomicrobiaceae bacterium]
MTSVTGQGAAAESYSGFAKFLHWAVAICVLVMIPVGVIMHNLEPGNLQNVLYTIHRSFGIIVLALMIVRIFYRLSHGAPPPEPTLDPIQRIASHLVHMALYVLVTAQALIGWIATSAYGAPISFFGLFTVPALVEKDQTLATPLFAAHEILAFVIAGLLMVHIGAALYHYFIRKDGVLQRMLP